MKLLKTLAIAAVLSITAMFASADAATRREFPGGFYGDALPGGEFAVLIAGQSVDTHLGRIPLPAHELNGGGLGPLYLRVHAAPFRFAGQSHAHSATWEWTQAGWQLLGPSCGTSPAIYDAAGTLRLSDCSIGSQGWRYVDEGGRLVTGDETYADRENRIWEWTKLGGLTVGQGAESGCIALRGAERRLLEPGDCRFVRFNKSGTTNAVTMSKFGERKVVVLWFEDAELSSFPAEPAPAPAPAPAADPVSVSVSAANDVNQRFPGLRQQANFEWIKKVVASAAATDPRIGHSSSHSDVSATRRNELGILEGADVVGGKQAYRSVSLFQINPLAGDPMRLTPIVEDRFDFWFPRSADELPPPVVECGTVPVVGQDALKKLAQMFPAMVRSPSDDERRQWARKAAEQMAFTVDRAWGTKNAGGGRPPSKDAIAKVVGGMLCGWDIVNGTTRELSFGHGEPLPGQEFIPVTPINHVGGGGPVDVPPVDDGEVKKLRARVAELEAAIAAERAANAGANRRVRELEQERDELKSVLAGVDARLQAKDAELNQLRIELAKPVSCVTKAPPIVKRLGIRIGCEVVR